MESNTYEDSKSSSEEDDRSDQGSGDDMGTGRFYECVFCKRGFTTAQALGGHMNIHRKDRAKKRSSSFIPSISEKVDENYTSFGSFMPFQSYPNTHHFAGAPSSEVHVNYQTFFPSSPWYERSMQTNHSYDFQCSYGNHPQHMNLFGDDVWRGNRGVGTTHVSDDLNERREDASEEEEEEEEDDELDLELRLGHDP